MSLLTTKKYTAVMLVQYALLLYDIGINSFASFARNKNIDLLVLYVVQDFGLIVALTILLVNFFSTYIFQAGLIQLLYKRFRMTLLLCVIYIILSITLHCWHMTLHWTKPLIHQWNRGYHSLYATQKIVAVFYYYFYKRASLRIADPRFYESSSWVQKQLNLSSARN